MVDTLETPQAEAVPAIRLLLADLAEVREQQAEYEPILSVLAEREKNIRAAIHDEMAATASERVRGSGLVVIRSVRNSPQVGDMGALTDFLEENNVLGKYTTIDTGRVLKDFGAGVPGVRINTTEYITVKDDASSQGGK